MVNMVFQRKLLAQETRGISPFEAALGIVWQPDRNDGSLMVQDFHANQKGNVQGGILAALLLFAAEEVNGERGFHPVEVNAQFVKPASVGETVHFAAIGTGGNNFRTFESTVMNARNRVVARGSILLARATGQVEQGMRCSSARQMISACRSSSPQGQRNFEGFGGLNPYCRWLGFRFTDIALGEVFGHLGPRDFQQDGEGRIHPAVLVSALDSIAGDAGLSLYDPGRFGFLPAVHLTVTLYGSYPWRQENDLVMTGNVEAVMPRADGAELVWSKAEIRVPGEFLLARAELLQLAVLR